jgi:hypothetical protein
LDRSRWSVLLFLSEKHRQPQTFQYPPSITTPFLSYPTTNHPTWHVTLDTCSNSKNELKLCCELALLRLGCVPNSAQRSLTESSQIPINGPSFIWLKRDQGARRTVRSIESLESHYCSASAGEFSTCQGVQQVGSTPHPHVQSPGREID